MSTPTLRGAAPFPRRLSASLTGPVAAVALLTLTALPVATHDGSRVCVGAMKTVTCVPPEQIPPKAPEVPRI